MGILKKIEENKLIAIIKSSSASDAKEMVKAAIAGGFHIFEISLLTPGAMKLIEVYSQNKGMLVGAGAVMDGELAQRAIKSGAHFLSTPYIDKEVITVANNNGVFVIQGALTPTEIFTAYRLGADLVMIYPIAFSGGPEYLKALKRALPTKRFMSCGGIDLDNIFEYLKDSVAVGVKQSLFEQPLVRKDNWKQITERARQFNQKLGTIKVGR